MRESDRAFVGLRAQRTLSTEEKADAEVAIL